MGRTERFTPPNVTTSSRLDNKLTYHRGDSGIMAKTIVVVEDLIFLSRIQQTAKLVNAEIETARLDELPARLSGAPVRAIILDLNHRSGCAVEALRTLKSDPSTENIPVIGFVSHVQGDVVRAAREAGCDMVMARSAFVQKLSELLQQYKSQ